MKARWPVIAPCLIAGMILFFSCSRWFKPVAPKLTVVISVDQMRYDYLTRLAGLYSGGLAKLLREGAVFTNAHHDHAGTETAPGHATLLTGSHPAHHGIIANNWLDRETNQSIYAVDDPNAARVVSGEVASLSTGKSPQRLLRHTLGDWLKAKYFGARVISIAGKDRSAILMAGWEADAAYWFDNQTGGFISSRFYLDALPAWAQQWNAERHADRYLNRPWEKSRPEKDYFISREDLFSAEADGESTTFPHAFTGDDETLLDASRAKIDSRFYDWLAEKPFIDALTLEFAEQAVISEKLGADDTPDLLLIGLKATDAVGHAFGPLSQESEDNLLRLDAELAEFFAFLETQVGMQNCLIALSADHGVLPLPEELRRRGFESARVLTAEAIDEVKSVEKEMQAEWRTHRPILRNHLDGINLDYHVADSLKLSPAEFRSRVAAKLRSLSFVSDIFTSDELNATNSSPREYLDKQRHSFHPDRSADLTMQLKPYYLVSDGPHGTTHGSPYAYDSHVPLIFWGARIQPGRIDTPHRTVDLAPTLAYLLTLDLPADLQRPYGQRRVANSRPGSVRVEAAIDGEVLKMVMK
jgi:predicted AlkP superfamily pyrophosphatase or phosphodiesterase